MNEHPALSPEQTSKKLNPRNEQLSRIVSRLTSRRVQNSVIRHWNKTRRLPEGFLRSPLFSPVAGTRWRVLESA